MSGGDDKQVKLWSMNVPPHYVLASQETFSSSIVGGNQWSPFGLMDIVGFSGRNPYMCFGVSYSGECITQYMTEEFMTPLINSR